MKFEDLENLDDSSIDNDEAIRALYLDSVKATFSPGDAEDIIESWAAVYLSNLTNCKVDSIRQRYYVAQRLIYHLRPIDQQGISFADYDFAAVDGWTPMTEEELSQ